MRYMISFFFVLFNIVLLQAKIYIVPENFNSIQEAIDYSAKGDTIIVKPGIYKEKLIIKDKNLFIASKFLFAHDKKYVSNTILSGEGKNCVVSFENCPTGTRFMGFSIINGYSKVGGGISIKNSTIELENINIIQNTAEIKGGGLYGFKSNITLINSEIKKNSSIGIGGGGGGILIEYGSFSAINLKIEDNLAFLGGGAYILKSDVQIKNVDIKKNNAESKAGEIYFLNCENGIMKNVNIIENSAFKEGGEGGGLCLDTSNPMIVNVKISNNLAFKGAGGYLTFADPKFVSCLIDNNKAKDMGGAFLIYHSKPTFQNVTFVDNKASKGGALYNSSMSNPKIENCIFWNNKEDIFCDYTSDYTISYSMIKGNYHGRYLYDKEPIFVDYKNKDYHLNKTSFGFDKGNPMKKYNDRDGSRNDLGCYGGKFGNWK